MKKGKYLISFLLIICLAIAGGTAKMMPEKAGGGSTASASNASGTGESTQQQSGAAGQTSGGAVTDTGKEESGNSGTETPSSSDNTETPSPTPTPEPEYFELSFVGDCTVASSQYYRGTAQGYDTIMNGDYSYPFSKTVSYFENDDFTFANMECALTESNAAAQKTFVFKSPADYAKIFTEGSVEFVSLANNHVLDYGKDGYADTKAAIAAEGIGYAGRDEYAIYETSRGLKIGVYAVSFGTTDQIKAGIKALQDLGAEFIIAAIHWGDEGSYKVNSEQKTLAHAAVDAGADFVYGSHPHTLQPYEEYNGVLIYYSMGNWTFGGNTNPRDKDTFILKLYLRKDADGSVSVESKEEIPCASSGVADGNDYCPLPYEDKSEDYYRTLAKLNGTFDGSNLSISYSYSANE